MNTRKILSRQKEVLELVKEAAQALDEKVNVQTLEQMCQKAILIDAPSPEYDWFWNQSCFDDFPGVPTEVIIIRL